MAFPKKIGGLVMGSMENMAGGRDYMNGVAVSPKTEGGSTQKRAQVRSRPQKVLD